MHKPLSFIALLLSALLLGQARGADCPAPTEPTDAQFAEWAAKAPDRGALWRITRDGHSSYLFGSIHVGKPEWIFAGPKLREAWAQSDALALEIDISDPNTLKTLRNTPPLALPAPLRLRLNAQLRAYCVAPEPLEGLHPLLQLSYVSVAVGQAEGYNPGYGQELAMLGIAQQLKRPVIGLETVATQIKAMIPRAPEAARTDLAEGLDQIESGLTLRMLRSLASAWERGDIETLSNMERWCECKPSSREAEQLRRLNDARNPAMATRIAALHRQGHRLLVAVGILHMTGPKALPRLLAAQGFKVEALVPAQAKNPPP